MKFDTKNIFWVLINVTLAVLIFVLIAGSTALARYGRSLAPARLINISADGEVVAVPDIAKVNFSVVSDGVDPITIQTENTKKVNSAIDFVKAQGISAKDIKTSQYNLSPRYEYDEKRRQSFISGYELRQSVEVKIRDFSKIAAILGGLPERGINEIGQLQFDIDDRDVYLNQARKEAFAKARTKAEAMAKQNGTRIKRVVTFSESQGYVPPIFYAAKESGFEGSPAPMPTIEPGSQEVKVQVTVTYEIK